MLDNFRKIDVTWDKASRKIYELIKTASSDENGRKLVVQVLDGGQVEDLSGTSLHLYWETANEKNKGLDAFEEVDASKGIFQIYFTTEMASNVGTLTAHLHLVDDQGTVTSEPFKISVFKGVDNDAVESSNSFSSLTKILIEARNLEENYAPQLAELKENDESITAQLAQKASQDEVNTLSTNKADKVNTYTKTEVYNKTEVDGKTWTLSNLGQDVKEAMTGGSVAVVGTDAVDTTNVKDEAIKFSKRTVLGNMVNVNYYQQPINFNTVDGSVTIPINTRLRSGLHSKRIESDLTIVTGGTGYYLMWDVQTGEIINVGINAGTSAYNENMVMLASVTYPMDVGRFKVEGLENYTINGEKRIIPSTEQTALGKTAYITYGYGRCIDLNSTTGELTIPKDTVFRNGKYMLRTNSEITISLTPGYSYVFLDVDTNEFVALRYNVLATNFKESHLYVCSATWDSNNSHFNDIQGVNKYTIDGVLNGLDLDIETMKYSMDHPLFIPRKHRFIGHRGLSGLKPENTIPAFDECGIKGIFGVETDIRKTSDGHFVCMHDATVDKTTNGTGNVSDMTLEQIRSLTIDYGKDIENYTDLKVPTLEEMLHSCGRYGTVPVLHLYTDIGDEPAIVEIVNALGFEKSVIYTSTSPTMLNNIAKISDSLTFGLGGSTSDLSTINPPTRNNYGRYLDVGAYDNYPNAIKEIHSHKMIAGGWVENNEERANDLFEKGMDFIATDFLY